MKKVLYLGLEIPPHLESPQVVHCPIIAIIPRPIDDPALVQAFEMLPLCTHLLFTSKSAAGIFLDYASKLHIPIHTLQSKTVIAVGKRTGAFLTHRGIPAPLIAETETAEGIIDLLKTLNLNNSSLLWPRSALARPLISAWLSSHGIPFNDPIFYDTAFTTPDPLPDLALFDEIIFTSPSTVEAFVALYKTLPRDKTLRCIGPITQARLNRLIPFAKQSSKRYQ